MPSFLCLVNIVDIKSPFAMSNLLKNSFLTESENFSINNILFYAVKSLYPDIMLVSWGSFFNLNSMWQWTLSRVKAPEANFSQLCAKSFSLPALNCVVLIRETSPLKIYMFEFLTPFVVCAFTGVVFKAFSPCSSLPLFAVSDMGFRRGMQGAFLKKDAG